MSNPVKIDYSASDFLGGTILLDAWEELAFRRICDLVYVTRDNLADNNKMGQLTKTGRRWSKIRARLIELEKIEIVDGRISQLRCRKELEAANLRIETASKAGKVSAEKRKSGISASITRRDVVDVEGDKCPQNDTIPVSGISSKPLEDNNTASTGVGSPVGTQDPTQDPTTHQPPTTIEKNPPVPDGTAPPQGAAGQPPPGPENLVRTAKNETAKRGTRLAPDWQPTAEHTKLGVELGVDTPGEAEKFRDYWTAESGQRASKRDWDAAFRNWLRKAAEYAGRGPNGAGKHGASGNRSEPASVVTAFRELQDRDTGANG